MKKVNIKILTRAGERTRDLMHRSLERYNELTKRTDCSHCIKQFPRNGSKVQKTNVKRKQNNFNKFFFLQCVYMLMLKRLKCLIYAVVASKLTLVCPYGSEFSKNQLKEAYKRIDPTITG